MNLSAASASVRVRVTLAVAVLVAVPVSLGAVLAVASIEESLRQDAREDTEDLAARIQEEVAKGFLDPSELADGELAGIDVFLRDGDGALVTVEGDPVEPVGEFVILDGVSVEFLRVELAYQAYDQCLADVLGDRIVDFDDPGSDKLFEAADEECYPLLPEAEFEEELDEAFEAFDRCIDDAVDRFDGFEDAFARAEEACFELLPEEDVFDEPIEGFETVGFPIITTSGAIGATTAGSLLEVERAVDAVQRSLWMVIPSLVALISALTWFTTGRALRPVGHMTDQVRRITSATLHERVPEPRSHDEVGELATTMNEMLDRLDTAVRKQRSFVSDASHELRTPVATIRTELEVALRHPDAADWEAVAANVLAEDARLEHLVSDLLLLARTDEQAVRPGSGSRVDLEDLVRVEAGRARRTPVELGTVEAVSVSGRPEELRRMVAHLIDNAARHAETRVEVGLRTEGREVVLVVDDDGGGVPPEHRETVFERFGRLDEGRARDTGGAGLGLAVVVATVARHGGTVRLEDAAIGGARFEVRLPLQPDAGEDARRVG